MPHRQPGQGSRDVDVVHENYAVDGGIVSKNVGVCSCYVVAKIEVDGTACLISISGGDLLELR